MTQRYYENFAYADADKSILRKEDLKEWFDAGAYYHYKWEQGYKKSDQVIVYSNFSAQFNPDNPQILSFDHYWCSNGKVISVEKH